jgi:imidazolonepropionase-like amidohydrolase
MTERHRLQVRCNGYAFVSSSRRTHSHVCRINPCRAAARPRRRNVLQRLHDRSRYLLSMSPTIRMVSLCSRPTRLVRRIPLALAGLLLFGALRPGAAAQSPEAVPQVTRTFALERARVVQAPGKVLERATVVIRDGLIRAVGPDVSVPFDAERIAADSLVVYAGFIDGLSHAGLPHADKEETNGDAPKRPEDPGNPPADLAGIQPGRDARALLDPSDEQIAQLRQAGFTIAHVVPHGGMLPGAGALVLLTEGKPQDLVLKGDVSRFAQLEPASRMYPATDMGVLAQLRQLYREAQRRQHVEQRYAEDPVGLARPAYDPAHAAFFPVLEGRTPIFFHTESVLDLHRVLALQRTLGFPLVLTGLRGSFAAIDALQQAAAPLLLTLALPEEADKKTAADSTAADSLAAPPADTVHAMTPTAPGSFFASDQRTRSYEDLEDEVRTLKARQAFERAKYDKTAGWLHAAGLRFGFTTVDLKQPAQALPNLRKMIENGLPEDAALAALTTTPAEILGLTASAGTVEPGKMANLVVATGPLSDAETQIRYVFVDGRKFELEAEKTGDEAGAVDPAGTWTYTVETPDGPVRGTLTLSGTPDALAGTITNDALQGEAPLENVMRNDDVLSFDFDGGSYGQVSMTLTLSEDDLEGSVEVPGMGGMPVTGSRTSGPDR